MTEQEKFLRRFRDLKSQGLVDIKFFVDPKAKLSTEEFFGAANRISDSVEAGACRRHENWPRLEQQDIAPLLK